MFLRPEEFVGDFWSEIPPDGDCAYNCQRIKKFKVHTVFAHNTLNILLITI
jgi:hypothetical protein